MIYKCKNCDGNMIYRVEERKLYCTYCNSLDTEKMVNGYDMYVCDSCGGQLDVRQYESAGKCPYCSQYIIHSQRVEGELKPSKILPFKVGKEQAKTMIRLEYRKKMYVPDSFLKEVSLQKMEGIYVPFWMYNINAAVDFYGTATKECVAFNPEANAMAMSRYKVYRKFGAAFRRMPVDASLAMPDEIMDMLEPYDYQELEDFAPKYMSGFFGEIYSDNAKNFEPRAIEKVTQDTKLLLDKALNGFKYVSPIENTMTTDIIGTEYVLLPVWKYLYFYRGKKFEYYINGQTGKVIGEAPFSMRKMIAYGATVFLMVLLGAWMILVMLFGV